jgi:2'-5' RNA ligase
MSNIRTFIALPSSTEVQQKMVAIQSELRATQADVKRDSQDKFHITLKFLGNTEESKIEPLSEALANCVKSSSVFEFSYQSLGAFPNIQNPRVVWIGTVHNRAVLDLQSGIEQVCLKFGFPKEDRAFHPHITLGRIKGSRNQVRLTEAIKTITFEPMQSRCTEVLLMKSDLRPGGSIYTILKSFSLQT